MKCHLKVGLLLLVVWGMLPTACYDGGLVGAECGKGFSECDGYCVDLSRDRDNCGACGVVCPAGRACHAGEYCEGFGPGAGEAGASSR